MILSIVLTIAMLYIVLCILRYIVPMVFDIIVSMAAFLFTLIELAFEYFPVLTIVILAVILIRRVV